MENRPDLQAARLQLEASGYDLSAAKMNLLPSFSLSGGPGSRSEEFGDLLDNRFRTWEVSGSVTQPLFNGGRFGQISAGRRLCERQQRQITVLSPCAFTEAETCLQTRVFTKGGELFKERIHGRSNRSQTSWDRYQRGVQGIFDTLKVKGVRLMLRADYSVPVRSVSLTESIYFSIGHTCPSH